MHTIQSMRGGSDGTPRDNDPEFGSRMKGKGAWADLLWRRFRLACRRVGLTGERVKLDCGRFVPPQVDGQMRLL